MNIIGLILISILLLLGIIKLYIHIDKKLDLSTNIVLIANGQILGERKRQEDSFSSIRKGNKILALVADGMGGLSSGKQASNLAIKTFLEEFSRRYKFDSLNKFLINTAYISNKKILEQIEDRRIGTTLIAVLLVEDKCYWLSIGDSNFFIYRDRKLKKINRKHLYKNRLKLAYRNGEISRSEMLNHPKRDMLTSYLGYDGFHKLEYSKIPLELRKKDKLLLCSDGITDALSVRELEKILDENLSPAKSVDLILKKIKDKGIIEQDNATVILLSNCTKIDYIKHILSERRNALK